MVDLHKYRVIRLNANLFPVSEFERQMCADFGLRVEAVAANEPEQILPFAADCDALFVVSASLPAHVIQALTRCRVISRLGTGVDKIDVREATRRGIVVANVPYFCVEEQADHTMALLLSIARKLDAMRDVMRRGAWVEARRISGFNRRLSTQTLGLVGFGNSAKAVARRALGFGMRVLSTRRTMTAEPEVAAQLGVQMCSFEDLLAESDFVSLHLPLLEETRHLIDEAALKRMKPGSALINTSRGAIVDETALVAALQSQHLGGAGIDTFDQINIHDADETPPDHPLLSLENVVLTPHVGAFSIEAKRDVTTGGVENLSAVLRGEWPTTKNIVNPEVVPRFPLKPTV